MAPTYLYCTACGAANQTQDAFCFACGRPLRTTTSSMHYPTISSASNTLTGLLTFNHLLKQRYRILEQLGKGGFGAVYKAEDTQFGNRLVAVKEMSQRELKTQQEIAEATDAFRREALMLAGLRHQHLPRIYDHFSDGGRWYLVMDYIEGETLGDHLNKVGGHLPVEEALQIGIQLCAVLDYLHTRQPSIIFRDLTPNNIMLTSEGHLYLIDFGIARLFKPGQAKDTTAFGTLGYAAPELLSKQTTPQSDIYSLGAILHQMLTGMDPAQKPFRFAPPPWSGNPALTRLSTLIMHMLDMDESRRPASMTAVKQELQQIIAQLAGKISLPPMQPVGRTLPSPTQGFYERKRIFSIIAGVIAVVLIGGYLISAITNHTLQSSPPSAANSASNSTVPSPPAPTTPPTPALTPSPTPTPAPSPTPSPLPRPNTLLYQENGSDNWQGWALSSDWKTVENNKLLVNDGSHISNLVGPTAIPPYTVPNSVQNFAVETTITSPQPSGNTHFGFTVCGSTTASGWQGYEGIMAYDSSLHVQIWANTDKLAEADFDPGTRPHTYRLEVKGNVITLSIDNAQVAQATDNKFLTCGRQVGLLSSLVVLNVSSFKIIAL